jgi:hypothetical protein
MPYAYIIFFISVIVRFYIFIKIIHEYLAQLAHGKMNIAILDTFAYRKMAAAAGDDPQLQFTLEQRLEEQTDLIRWFKKVCLFFLPLF